MTPKELEQARDALGQMWRLGGPLKAADLGRLLEIERRDPGATVRAWETGKTQDVPGPVSAYVKALLAGYVPDNAPQGAPVVTEPQPPRMKTRRRG